MLLLLLLVMVSLLLVSAKAFTIIPIKPRAALVSTSLSSSSLRRTNWWSGQPYTGGRPKLPTTILHCQRRAGFGGRHVWFGLPTSLRARELSTACTSSLHYKNCDDDEDVLAAIEEETFVEGVPFDLKQEPETATKTSLLLETSTTKSPFEVTAPFAPQGDQPAAIQQLVTQLQENDRFSVLQGITGSGKSLVAAHVIAKHGRPALVLCHNKTLAAQLARELRSFLGKNAVELFVSYYNHYVPESFNEVSGKYVAKKSSINQDIDAMRHRATRALLTRNDVVIVASVSCIYGLGLPQEYLDASRTIVVGDVVGSSPQDFYDILNGMLYQHTPQDDDFGRGTYQISEQVGADESSCDISLWPPHESYPLRIKLQRRQRTEDDTTATEDRDKDEWFVSVLAQGHLAGHEPIESTQLFPAKHHVMSEDRVEQACLAIEDECAQRVKELTADGKHDEANRLQQRVYNDVLMMRETGFCSGAENYSRHLAGRLPGQPPSTLMDYFSLQGRRDWLLMVDESHVTLPQLRAMYAGDRARKERLVKHGYRLPSALDNRPLQEPEFWERVKQTLFISATPAPKEISLSERAPVEMIVRPTFVCDPVIEVKARDGQLDDLVKEVKQRAQRQERALAVTLTKRDAEDLSEYLNQNGIASTFIHSGLNTQERAGALKALQSGDVDCLVGVCLLREGLDLPQVSLVAILNADSEGFLRSETALLQMVGRAARNTQGSAILYANRTTKSMQKCIDATNFRRQKQLAYNRENAVQMKSTKGSSMLSIFDLLKEQIAKEQPLEVVGRKTSTRGRVDKAKLDSTRPDGSVPITPATEINTGHVPSSPGVYFWKDSDGKILYVGKAKKLRSRLKSYIAPGAKHSRRIQVMMEKARSIDFILTNSEREALLLESNLIKHHQPPYNVLLKDDESYPLICASIGDNFPRFFAVPRRYEENPSAKRYRYFGPYPHYKECNKILEGIENQYDLRAKSFMARHDPEKMPKEEYHKLFQQALDENFGSGGLASKSSLVAMRNEFEEAGHLFDPELNCSRDVVALEGIPGSGNDVLVHLMQFRDGMVIGRFSYQVNLPCGIESNEDRASVILHVLEKHYPSAEESADKNFSFFPGEILVQYLPENTKDLKRTIRSRRREVEPERLDNVVVRSVAKRGQRQQSDERAMHLVAANAKQVAFERSLESIEKVVKSSVDGTALTELASLLNLEGEPSRIECYDVSHSQGEYPVASRVVFVDGKPVPSLYRKFNIRSVDGPDDYASLEETLERRFKRAWMYGEGGPVDDDDPWSLPDVVLIDGGLGQLNAAAKGMAKARVFPPEKEHEKSPRNGEQRGATVALCSLAKSQEDLFVYGMKKPVNDIPDSPALLLLRALRDESHRFALASHRSRRSVRKTNQA